MELKKLIYSLLGLSIFVLSACSSELTEIGNPSSTPIDGFVSETITVPMPTSTALDPTNTDEPQNLPTLTPKSISTPTPWIPMPLMGVEAHKPDAESVQLLLQDVGATLVRLNGVKWHEVEAEQGQYNWATLEKLELGLQALAAQDIETILIIRGTPVWAQKIPGAFCGPIKEKNLQDFANFITVLAERYSEPPYNVNYWELGNEPDVAPELIPPTHPFGCWGESQDPYYGGEYYAEMLKVAYPAIKAVNPNAQVLIGGLLLDCDPYNPPDGQDCLPARFLKGVLLNGGADYFDIVSFHGYPFYVNQSLSLDVENPSWKHRGGVVVGKIDYLREVLQEFGVDKPIFLTESSLNCPSWNTRECDPPDEFFYEIQADYLVRLFVRNWALDIAGSVWYDFEGHGWRYGGLVGGDQKNPNPAFQAFKFLNEKMIGMVYVGSMQISEGIQGYKFSNEDHQTWVLWSIDETPQELVLPENLVAIYDKYGNDVSILEHQLQVTSPIYLDIKP